MTCTRSKHRVTNYRSRKVTQPFKRDPCYFPRYILKNIKNETRAWY